MWRDLRYIHTKLNNTIPCFVFNTRLVGIFDSSLQIGSSLGLRIQVLRCNFWHTTGTQWCQLLSAYQVKTHYHHYLSFKEGRMLRETIQTCKPWQKKNHEADGAVHLMSTRVSFARFWYKSPAIRIKLVIRAFVLGTILTIHALVHAEVSISNEVVHGQKLSLLIFYFWCTWSTMHWVDNYRKVLIIWDIYKDQTNFGVNCTNKRSIFFL